MKTKLIIDTEREGYGTDQVRHTMTVGDLIAALEQYDEDTPVFLSFDRRYTYGGITEPASRRWRPTRTTSKGGEFPC